MGHVVDPPLVSCPLLACHLSHTGTGGRGAEKPRRRPAGRLILTEQGRHPPHTGTNSNRPRALPAALQPVSPCALLVGAETRRDRGPPPQPGLRGSVFEEDGVPWLRPWACKADRSAEVHHRPRGSHGGLDLPGSAGQG